MNIGSFRHKLQILNRTDSVDSYGEKVNTYSPRTTVWAARGDVTRKYSPKDAIGIDTEQFTIRYLKDLNSDLRVKHRDIEYQIVDVVAKGRDEYMVLTIKKIDNLV